MKTLINAVLGSIDLRLMRKSAYKNLCSIAAERNDCVGQIRLYEHAEIVGSKFLIEYLNNVRESKSQLGQDLFALSELGFKRNGFFIEFGATDGVGLSNTHILEKKFGWKGILAEPAKIWHTSLRKNRSAAIETDCVWRKSGDTLLFNEVTEGTHTGELSTIDTFSGADNHRKIRELASNKYEVNTISLSDMLKKHGAPKEIDYLSIDTEGSEYEILSAFDFKEYDIKVITCEHNYTDMREKILSLLSGHGYERKFDDLSLFDDWYVKN